MQDIAGLVMEKSIKYFQGIEELEDCEPSAMLVDFVIEKYRDVRNYPSNFSEEQIETDMAKHITTLAMAVVDLYMKIGAEGETSHNEKNIHRTYENAYISSSIFSDILPYVKVF